MRVKHGAKNLNLFKNIEVFLEKQTLKTLILKEFKVI